jgi:peptide/nickel transport system substrate-binding protein
VSRETAMPEPRSAVESVLLEEWRAARIGRRDFLRFAALLGMAVPLGACGRAPQATGRPGLITVGMPVPAGLIDPLTVGDTGGVCLLSQCGEYLAVSDADLHLEPQLAIGWRPNEDGSVWTLSAFAGTLSKGGARALDAGTVEFRLDAPNGSFPYLVSSDNYNAIILPADYRGGFERDFIGTGPFRLERYVPKARASFVRSDRYWGAKALPDRVLFSFYDSIQAQVLAMQGGQLDVLLHVPVQGGQGLLADPHLNIVALPSSAHEQVHMRTDQGRFADKRVRRAVALALNRENLVRGMFRGRAALGNDSPFAPIFPATDPAVPQRHLDLTEAKALMAAAGVPNGFAAVLTAERYQELPDYAVVIQNAVRKIGIDLTLNVEDQSAYYGRAVFGSSDWLDSQMGIEDYGHRGVPNTLLTASLGSRGPFNAAHFKNPEYDGLVASYIAALDPATQRACAGRIQRLLLEETPLIIGYFYEWLSVTAKQVSGVRPSANGQLNLAEARTARE